MKHISPKEINYLHVRTKIPMLINAQGQQILPTIKGKVKTRLVVRASQNQHEDTRAVMSNL